MENTQNVSEKKVGKIDKFFGITKMGSSFKIEIIAGLTTFMAMVYILMVNAGMFSSPWMGVSYGAAYIATAIGAIVGTLLMAFLAKMPLAQASGMGINAFIVYTLMLNGTNLTYANCMMFTLIDGVIFIVLTVTGLRKQIFAAIPEAVRKAIGVGIGLFIAFIGFQQSGVVLDEGSTLVQLVSFNILNASNHLIGVENGSVVGMLPALVAIVGVLIIAILEHKKVKGSILWGLLSAAVLFYAGVVIANACGYSYTYTVESIVNGEVVTNTYTTGASDVLASITWSNPFDAFKDWGNQSVGKVFTEGFNFAGYNGTTGGLVLLVITTALSLCMIDMFDTIGTLYGACSRGNLLDEDGTPLNMNKCMLADAIATFVGAVAGTSTVTTFVESSAGVAAGGKTGFTALVTGVMFILAMFLSPIAELVPRCATASALIWVGILMMNSVGKIDWSNPIEAIVAFFTLIVMCLGYSISKGIGMGILVYCFVMICTGKAKEISIPTWVIGAIYTATFLLT